LSIVAQGGEAGKTARKAARNEKARPKGSSFRAGVHLPFAEIAYVHAKDWETGQQN
jgi:hypothetical protein